MEVQVYPDGAQVELTPGYHNVALRNMLAIPRLAKVYGYKLPAGYVAGLEKMFAYNMWAMQPDGDVPHWNDSGSVDVREILADGAALFPHRRDFLWIATGGKQGTPPDHTTTSFLGPDRWLCAPAGTARRCFSDSRSDLMAPVINTKTSCRW